MILLIAVLVAAVLFVDRGVPSADIGRRLHQVALAITLVLLTFAVAVLVFPGPDIEELDISESIASGEAADTLRGRSILIAAAGLGLIFAGFLWASKWPTSNLALILAGVVLLVTRLDATDQTSLVTALYDLSGKAGRDFNLIYTMILGAGAFGLFYHGFATWDHRGPITEIVDREGSL
jgi:hypothetical protein